jgi:hypothetical protein
MSPFPPRRGIAFAPSQQRPGIWTPVRVMAPLHFAGGAPRHPTRRACTRAGTRARRVAPLAPRTRTHCNHRVGYVVCNTARWGQGGGGRVHTPEHVFKVRLHEALEQLGGADVVSAPLALLDAPVHLRLIAGASLCALARPSAARMHPWGAQGDLSRGRGSGGRQRRELLAVVNCCGHPCIHPARFSSRGNSRLQSSLWARGVPLCGRRDWLCAPVSANFPPGAGRAC